MTYCLALRLDEGLVFLADTRTNAGVDNVEHLPQAARAAAGARPRLRARVGRQPRHHPGGARPHPTATSPRGDGESLATVDHLFEAALYVGRLSREVAERHREALAAAGADGTATFILGGQVGGEPPDILLVYPEGNYIRASDERPVPADRREQVRQVHARAGRRRADVDLDDGRSRSRSAR